MTTNFKSQDAGLDKELPPEDQEIREWLLRHCVGSILVIGDLPDFLRAPLEKSGAELCESDKVSGKASHELFAERRFSGKFSTIIFWDIQKLPTPDMVLQKARQLLKPDGVLLVTAFFGIREASHSFYAYYLTDLEKLLSTRFHVNEWEITGNHIRMACCQQDKLAPLCHHDPDTTRKIEAAFHGRQKELFRQLQAAREDLEAAKRDKVALIDSFSGKLAETQEKYEHVLADVMAFAKEYRAAASADLERENAESRQALEKMTAQFQDTLEHNKKLEENEKKLRADLAEIQKSVNYRIGSAFLSAGKSWGNFFRFPYTLLKLSYEAFKKSRSKTGVPKDDKKLLKPSPKFDKKQIRPPFRDRLRVAAIMDEFTYKSYLPECEILQLSLALCMREVDNFKPDLLFIESAWQGKNGEWNLKISSFSPELQSLVTHCRGKGIPVVFWNKEDPPHFHTFLPVAKSADFIFTTDMDCIPRYKKAVGHDRVYLLPFAAQTRTHNPAEKYEREQGFCFAGSYYTRYPERGRDFDSLVDTLAKHAPVEIYDRNFGKEHPYYLFPEKYKELIRGNLPYEEIDRAYKGYDFGINMNTGKQSQSMFSRRVFELVASNTIVISNFSRGMRNFFGDLVISGDDSREIERRLAPLLEDQSAYRKLRLAALRHVLENHTYRHRLQYIREKIWDIPPESAPLACIVAMVSNPAEAAILVESFQRQEYAAKKLWLIGENMGIETSENIHVAASPLAAREELEKEKPALVGLMAPAHFYGPHYLTDLALGLSWCDKPVFGKVARYKAVDGHARLWEDGAQYREAATAPIHAAMAKPEKWNDFWEALRKGHGEIGPAMAFDEFGFLENGIALPDAEKEKCLDTDILDRGIDYYGRLLPLSEKLTRRGEPVIYGNDARVFHGPSLAIMYRSRANKLKLQLIPDGLLVTSRLEKRAHLHTERKSREYLNLINNSDVQMEMEGDLDARFVFIFLDAENNKVGSQILQGSGVLVIPGECVNVEIILRVEGKGTARIRFLRMGRHINPPAALACRSDCLVVLKNYPAYDDLYKYTFAHSRVLGYKEYGRLVDIYRVHPCNASFREFEGVDVSSGDFRLLEDTLASGQITNVFVHLISRQIWNSLKKYLDNVRLVIWIHGAEIESWERREFEFVNMTPEEIEIKKRRCNGYLKLWREILALNHPNVEYVFVSETLRKRSEEDVGMPFPVDSTHVIHNFIDGKRFPYVEKTPDKRFRVFSTRPFSLRKYANDLSVAAIIELSRRPGFDRYHFTLRGDGEFFEDIVRPIRDFPNVDAEKKFLTHAEMAAQFAENGVLLNPSRSDTQGVTRDEAMASGLVPVTNAVDAIPEFTEPDCAILAPPEDAAALADGLQALADNPEKFLEMSRNAAAKPRKLSNSQATILRELRLIKDPLKVKSENAGGVQAGDK